MSLLFKSIAMGIYGGLALAYAPFTGLILAALVWALVTGKGR